MTGRALDRWRRWAALPALILALACSVTPVPEPPTAQPKEPDLAQIDAQVQTGILTTPVTVTGKPGSVEAGVLIWIVNLDTQDPPLETTAAPDGSFQITLPNGGIGQELRLQTRSDDGRSNPVDATIVSMAGLLSPSSRQACLTFTPAFELPFGGVALAKPTPKTFKIDNSCGADVVIDSAALRVPTAPFAVSTAFPLTISSDASASVTISFTPAASGLSEEVLLVRTTSPFTERRPITIYGVGK